MHNAIKRHRTDAITDTVPFQFSSVQDGIYALRKAQVCSSRSLRSFPKYCLKRWVLKLGSKAGRAVTDAIANCPIAVQLSSRWYFCTWKSPGVLPPPRLSEVSPNIVWRGGFWNWVWRQGERVEGCDKTGKQKAGWERVKGCDRTGKQKAGRESWGLWQNRETEGRERELRAVTEQGNRRQGERVEGCDRTGKQKNSRSVTEQELQVCDRTGKQKNSRFVTEQGNRRIPGKQKNSRFVTEQGNRRTAGLWQNRKTEEFQVCDRTGKQKNCRFVQQRNCRPVWPPRTGERSHQHIFSTIKQNSLNAVENLLASPFPEQM